MRVKAAEHGFFAAHDNYRWIYKKNPKKRERESVGVKAQWFRGKERIARRLCFTSCARAYADAFAGAFITHTATMVSLTQSWYLSIMSPLRFLGQQLTPM